MHVQEMPDAMSSTMPVVEAIFPQISTSPRVDEVSARVPWEDGGVDGNVSLEHSRERTYLFGARRAKVPGPCNIRCAVQELRTRVAKIDL